jgi:hypothetical protein
MRLDLIPTGLADPEAALPARIRYHPIRRALWRALLRRKSEFNGTAAARSSPIDTAAHKVVLCALSGDVRAVSLIAREIEGRMSAKLTVPFTGGREEISHARRRQPL